MTKSSMPFFRRAIAAAMPLKPAPMIATRGVSPVAFIGGALLFIETYRLAI
jgi:hypothetical protein